MLVYRVCKAKWARSLDGKGAAVVGGRWNLKGDAMVYTSATPELALLEFIVNLSPMEIPPTVQVTSILLSDLTIRELKIRDLPQHWDQYPFPTVLAEIGSAWLRSGKSLALAVPSAVVPVSVNYLLNPAHRAMKKARVADVSPIRFDPRIRG